MLGNLQYDHPGMRFNVVRCPWLTFLSKNLYKEKLEVVFMTSFVHMYKKMNGMHGGKINYWYWELGWKLVV